MSIADELLEAAAIFASTNRVALSSLLTRTQEHLERMERIVIEETMDQAPCKVCGYNGGPGYYQPSTHPCAAIWHAREKR